MADDSVQAIDQPVKERFVRSQGEPRPNLDGLAGLCRFGSEAAQRFDILEPQRLAEIANAERSRRGCAAASILSAIRSCPSSRTTIARVVAATRAAFVESVGAPSSASSLASRKAALGKQDLVAGGGS